VADAEPHSGLPSRETMVGRRLEVLLSAPGCAVCREITEAERLFLLWFLKEEAADPVMQARLREQLGFCPAHTRAVLNGGISAPTTLLPAWAAVLAGARRQLAQLDRPATLRCPRCADIEELEAHMLHTVADAVATTRFAELLATAGGVCVRHLRVAVSIADVGDRAIARVARITLAAGPRDEVAAIAGIDLDAATRAAVAAERPELLAKAGRGRSVLQTLLVDLELGVCPCCLAGGRTEQRHLRWLPNEIVRRPDAGDALCPTHLQDLAQLDRDAATNVARRQRAGALDRVGMLLGRLDELPPAALLARYRWARATRRHRIDEAAGDVRPELPSWRAAFRSQRDRVDRIARELFLARAPCPVCETRAAAERRRFELLVAAVGTPTVRNRFGSSGGVCVRHALAFADGEQHVPVLGATRAHLDVLAWEVEEARSKRAWQWRFEEMGDERTVWRRAPMALDGRVYMGGRAHAERAPDAG
jgi:hypothetical protein